MKQTPYNLPNIISFSRFFFAIIFVFSIIYSMFYLSILTLILTILSDFLDGHLARKTNKVPDIGEIIDPVVDKFFVCSAFIAFIIKYDLEIWKLLLVFSRDIFIAFGVLALAFTGHLNKIKFKAAFFGKMVTILQFAAVFFIVLNMPFQNYLLVLILVLSLLSFIEYSSITISKLKYL